MKPFTQFESFVHISGTHKKYRLDAPLVWEIGNKGTGWPLEIAACRATIRMRTRGWCLVGREGVARLERDHPRVSLELGGSDGRDRLGY
jgi:hypothetical protein